MMNHRASGPERSAYLGWVVAGVVLLAIFAGSAALWFIFHPW